MNRASDDGGERPFENRAAVAAAGAVRSGGTPALLACMKRDSRTPEHRLHGGRRPSMIGGCYDQELRWKGFTT